MNISSTNYVRHKIIIVIIIIFIMTIHIIFVIKKILKPKFFYWLPSYYFTSVFIKTVLPKIRPINIFFPHKWCFVSFIIQFVLTFIRICYNQRFNKKILLHVLYNRISICYKISNHLNIMQRQGLCYGHLKC